MGKREWKSGTMGMTEDDMSGEGRGCNGRGERIGGIRSDVCV